MISKVHRFHGHRSLNYVYNKGRTVRSSSLSVRFAPSNKDDYRLAVVVSKKISKSAVVRNRIRRRIYEIARRARAQSEKPWPYEIVITVHSENLATISAQDLEKQVLGLLQKAGIFSHKQ